TPGPRSAARTHSSSGRLTLILALASNIATSQTEIGLMRTSPASADLSISCTAVADNIARSPSTIQIQTWVSRTVSAGARLGIDLPRLTGRGDEVAPNCH